MIKIKNNSNFPKSILGSLTISKQKKQVVLLHKLCIIKFGEWSCDIKLIKAAFEKAAYDLISYPGIKFFLNESKKKLATHDSEVYLLTEGPVI